MPCPFGGSSKTLVAITRRNRLDPGRRMFLEIGFPQKASIRPHELVDLVCDLTFIKSVATFFSDQPQRFREGGILQNVALSRCSPFSVECVRLKKGAWQSFV